MIAYEILEAALLGCEVELARIEQKQLEIRTLLAARG